MDRRLILLTLALAALLLTGGTAYASSLSPASTGLATVSAAPEEFEVIEEVEEEDPAAECAEARAEFAHGEIEQEELEAFCEGVKGAGGSSSSQEAKCPLRSAHAHAATNHQTLKVTLGYTTYEPFKAELQLSSHLGTLKRHLSHTGTLRFTKQLGHMQPDKLILKLRPVGRAGCPSPRLVLLPK